MHLAKNIRFLRNKKGISQETLGELLGKSHKTVSSYESGQAELNLGMLGILKNYFEISLDALVFSDLSKMESSENLGMVAEPEVEYGAASERIVYQQLTTYIERECFATGGKCYFEQLKDANARIAELEKKLEEKK